MFIFKHKMLAADNRTFSMQRGCNAMCNDILHFCVFFFVMQVLFRSTLYNGSCDAVRKMLFQTSCCFQHFRFCICSKRNDLFQNGFCIGQCTSLIKDNRICLSKRFEILSALDGNITVRCFPNCRNYRNRRGKLDGTRIVHH